MDTAALKDSWELVAKSGDEVPLYFYSHLFLSRPDLRPMFPIAMTGQRDKLVGALGRIVSNVDQLDDVTPFIQQLGRDLRQAHAGLEISGDEFNVVVSYLAQALSEAGVPDEIIARVGDRLAATKTDVVAAGAR